MSDIAIRIESLSKQYRLGTVGTGTLSHDLNRWWHRVRGKEDPYLKIGETNDRAHRGSSEYVWALRDINLEVKQGEVLGIIGKNGAGKSTLLKILSKVTGPTTGRIMAKGRIASLLEVGTGFHPELTGRENIYLNGAILGMTKAEVSRKLDEIVDFAGVERYLDTPTKRYSSGMTVRLGFAVAAFLEEEILIVDEVLAVGDAEFQKKAIGKMQEVSSGGGRTVLFVSHNMASVEAICNRGILLNNGEVSFSGEISDTVQRYLSRNLQESNNENLLEEKDREGIGNIRIKSIQIIGEESPVSPFKIGESISFKIEYKSISREPIVNPRILIGIYNSRNEGISRFDSNSTSKLPKNFPVDGIISCSLNDKINLIPGVYYVNIAIFGSDKMQDYLAHKAQFEIVDRNYFGEGKLLDSTNLAKVVYKHEWEISN